MIKKSRNTRLRIRYYHVYDLRTTMTDFVASFAVREHAEKWGYEFFGEYAFITDSVLHTHGQMWNGKQ